MEAGPIQFYNGTDVPVPVRVLLFNDAINIYEKATDHFIYSIPVKGAVSKRSAERYFVYTPDQHSYLVFDSFNPLVKEISAQIENAGRSVIGKILRHRAFAFFMTGLVLLVGLYIGVISLVPYLGSKIIDANTEIKIGRNLRELMLKQESAIGARVDSAGSKKLQQFADQLKLSAKYPIHVTLVTSEIVNAYALPGGEIVVYTGILTRMNAYEELVALLAHESSHVNERHTLRSLLRSTANSIVISVLLGDVTGISGTIAGNIDNLNGLSYSRSLEKEADDQGMKVMLENKVNVAGMKQLMELLKREGEMPGTLEFLSTHPLSNDRIKAAEQFIKSHKGTADERKDLHALFVSLKHNK